MAFLDTIHLMVFMVMVASIVYYYRSEIKLSRNILSSESFSGKLGEEMDGQKYGVGSNFKCPRCGRKMEKITPHDSVFLWRNQMLRLGSSSFNSDIFSFANKQMSPFGLSTYRCKLCGTTYFDESGNILP